jgi:hypothetical protein
MAVPAATRRLIEQSWRLKEIVDLNGHHCEGAQFHSPTPICIRPYVLGQELLAPAEEDELDIATWLCGNCCDNLTVYLRLLFEYEDDLPWVVRREFGNLIRALGNKAHAEGS